MVLAVFLQYPCLNPFGTEVSEVAEQAILDGGFPTVDSPNPENAEALQMGIDQAKAEGADLLIGTDPDADRMGVAVRDSDGDMVLLTGMIGSMMAECGYSAQGCGPPSSRWFAQCSTY